MIKTETVRARVEPDLKHRAEDIFSVLGLNASQAITLFYRQVDLHGGLPFQVTIPVRADHIPNRVTEAALEEAERGDGVTRCNDAEDLFQRLGI